MFMDFRDRLRKEIERQGLSIPSLCTRADVKYTTVKTWFANKNRTEPSATNLFKVSRILGVSLDYIMTGEESALADDEFVCGEKVVEYRSDGKLYSNLKEEETLIVPVAPQKLSAGHGQEFLPVSSYTGSVRILKRMTYGIDPSLLVAAEVEGDSMVDAQISDRDMVIFAKGHIRGEGIYTISLYGEVMVKRLQFRMAENRVVIISENPKYEPMYISADDENLIIIGKVVGWIHCLN